MAGQGNAVRNIICRVGADVKPMQDGMKKAQNSLYSFSKQTNAILKSAAFAQLGYVAARGLRAVTNSVKDAISVYNEFSSANMGLQSILTAQGKSFENAKGFINNYINDGLIPLSDAATAYKQLASRGYDDEQIKNVLTRLKDAASFGRQSSLSIGEAVRSATEGLKNENSILVDNAGVTKNVSKMWEEYAANIGTTRDKLTQQQKIQAEVNGIMKETQFQVGNAAMYSKTLSGQLASLDAQTKQLKASIGGMLAPVLQTAIPMLIKAAQAVKIVTDAFAKMSPVLRYAIIGGITGLTAFAAAAAIAIPIVAGLAMVSAALGVALLPVLGTAAAIAAVFVAIGAIVGATFSKKINEKVQAINGEINRMMGESSDAAKGQEALADSIKDTGKEIGRNIQGFDEVNQIQDEMSNSALKASNAISSNIPSFNMPDMSDLDSERKEIHIPIIFDMPEPPVIPPPNTSAVTTALETVKSKIQALKETMPINIIFSMPDIESIVNTPFNNVMQNIGIWATNTKNAFSTWAESTRLSFETWKAGVKQTLDSWAIETRVTLNNWSMLSGNILKVFQNNNLLSTLQWANSTLSAFKLWAVGTKTTLLSWVINTGNLFNTWQTLVSTTLNSWKTNVESNLSTWSQNTQSTINTWAQNTKTTVTTWTSELSSNIASWVNNTSGNIASWAKSGITNIESFASGSWDAMKNFLNGTASSVASWASSTASNIASFASSAFNSISKLASAVGQSISTKVSFAASEIKNTFSGVVSWAEKNKDTISTITTIAGLTVAGVATVAGAPIVAGAAATAAAASLIVPNMNIPDMSKIPQLASGGIVSSPTLAMIGEAGTEAVVPLENNSFVDMMTSAFTNALLNMSQVSSSQDKAGTIQVNLNLDGATLTRQLVPLFEKEQSRIGTRLIPI